MRCKGAEKNSMILARVFPLFFLTIFFPVVLKRLSRFAIGFEGSGLLVLNALVYTAITPKLVYTLIYIIFGLLTGINKPGHQYGYGRSPEFSN